MRPEGTMPGESSAAAERARYTGAWVRRREDPRLLIGLGNYVDDLKMPGALHAAFVRSPHAHARIRRVGVSRALALDGVEAVLTGADLARLTNPIRVRVSMPVTPTAYCLAHDKVRYVGEPVAVVAAASRAVAEDACELIDVDYEPLPAVVDAERAMAPDAPLLFEELGSNVLWRGTFPYGDVEGAFAQADRVVRERITIHRYASTPLETFGGIASYDRGTGQLTIWGHAQIPGLVIGGLAHALKLTPGQIRFIHPQVGGAFGNKERTPYLVAIALLSMQLGRPVRYQEDRRESLTALTHSCDGILDCEAAVRADGTILGMRFRNVQNEGCSIEFATIHSLLMLSNLVNCYRMPAVATETYSVLTNKCPAGANRGVSKPFMCFAIERMVDRIARELGLDRLEVRFRNFIQPDEFPYTTPSGDVYDSGDYPGTLRLALGQIGYDDLRAQQAAARAEGRWVGIGIATAVEPASTNFGYSRLVNQQAALTGVGEAARIRVEWDGTVSVATGATDTGQGHETAIAQIVADELGVPLDAVCVAPYFDSATAPWLPVSGNFSNKFSGTDTGAILGAARKVKARLLELAGQMLDAAPADLELADGYVAVRGAPARRKRVAEIAGGAYWSLAGRGAGFEPGLEATHYYSNPLADLPDADGRVRAQMNFANAAHVALVEIDPETFQVAVQRYLVVHDCGKLINPMIVEGQVHGATVHGIAAALLEEFAYGEDGQFLTATFMDYLKPTAADVPRIETGHLETPSPFTPLGTKGAGEGGAVPAPAAIASAVEDALAPLGVKITSLPLTPSRLRDLVRAAEAATQGA
jgi:carbon-monoxide dehydrogenase large subunit